MDENEIKNKLTSNWSIDPSLHNTASAKNTYDKRKIKQLKIRSNQS